MGLYHADIFIPKTVRRKIWEYQKMQLDLTEHVKERMEQKNIKLPEVFNLENTIVFEVETEKKDIIKLVCRTPYNSDYDLCFAVNMINNSIITAWLNRKNDNHETLNRYKYDLR